MRRQYHNPSELTVLFPLPIQVALTDYFSEENQYSGKQDSAKLPEVKKEKGLGSFSFVT